MNKPNIIYCAGGNRKFAEIAIGNGFLYGARIPRDKPHYPIYFAGQDWKKPNRSQYMAQLKEYRPKIATVLDLQSLDQFGEVLSWAEEASQFCEYVVIIPKIPSVIKRLPKRINNKEVILGYSVPTKYGSTSVNPEEFAKWTVHSLGVSPHRQMAIWDIMSKYSCIFSVDGNFVQMIALKYNKFWTNGDATYAKNRWLPRLDEADGSKWLKDAHYEAFKRSCINIIDAWDKKIGK